MTVAGPPKGLLQFKITVTKPQSLNESCAFLAILLCRTCLFLTLCYALLALLSYATSPWSICVTFFGCECSCAVAMDTDEWNAFYHPGTPHELVAVRTVRPHTVDHDHLCGVCPNDWPDCVSKAKAQPRPNSQSFLATNLSTTYTCYLPECAHTVNNFYSAKTANRANPDEDVCLVDPNPGPPCYTDILNPQMCG